VLIKNYPFVVMDNEAGMEHLSRRTTQGVDYLLFVSDYSLKGIRTVGKIRELIDELKLSVKEKHLVVDRAPNGMDPVFSREVRDLGLDLLGAIPEDRFISEYEMKGRPLLELPDESPAVQVVDRMMERMMKT